MSGDDKDRREIAAATRRTLGLGQPLLSFPVGECEYSLHHKEWAGSATRGPGRIGSLWYMTVCPDGVGGGPVSGPWTGTVVGNVRVVCGTLPASAVSVEASTKAVPLPVRLAEGTWAFVAGDDGPLEIVFRGGAGDVVHRLDIAPR